MSKIEWTGQTWNPVVGCKKISPGCKNCYAETMTGRLELMGQEKYQGLTKPSADGKRRLFTGTFREVPDALDLPLHRKVPTTYFVNSMSDLFGEGVSNEFIAALFGVMAACPQHTFQVLTKRADRLPNWLDWIRVNARDVIYSHAFEKLGEGIDNMLLLSKHRAAFRNDWPLLNVHLGVSVEDRKHGLPRIGELRKVPAAVRFLSIEPLLEDLGTLDLAGIHWVIVGGESGHGARPVHPEWIRSIRDQCIAANVPFFFKQWGEYVPRAFTYTPQGDSGRVEMIRMGKKAAGRILDGRTWDEMPK